MPADLTLAIAVLGVGGFLADVVLHLVNGRRIRTLEAEVRTSVADAAARGQRIEGALGTIYQTLATPPSPAAFAHGQVEPRDARSRRAELEEIEAETSLQLVKAFGPTWLAVEAALPEKLRRHVLRKGTGAVEAARDLVQRHTGRSTPGNGNVPVGGWS